MASNRNSLLGRQIVWIDVGEADFDPQRFAVHKKLICVSSAYFMAAFTTGFMESRTGLMKLPGISTAVFSLFYLWLYSGNIWQKSETEDTWPDSEILVKLYVFADMIKCIPLKNYTIDLLLTQANKNNEIPTSDFEFIWSSTAKGSKLRDLAIDWILWKLDPDHLRNCPEQFPRALLLELATEASRLIGQDPEENPLEDASNYHEQEPQQ